MEKINIFLEHNLNIPNILSFIRILLILPFIIFFLNEEYIWAAGMLIISGVSDMFDGIIARKLNQITELGKMLDPVADKLTLVAVIICLGIQFPVILPIVIILLIKDVAMVIAGAFLLKKNIRPPAAKWYGKLATVVFYFSVLIIVGLKAIFGIVNVWVSVILLSITALLMIFAFIKYFLIYIELINSNN